ncbi:YqzE family protein [Sediminibacillus massiliensis]|uniref:YqzE family protein n=1 Tax=Sediminibacillus massiliensis TaxID=1926277 RepID=UPI0009886D59|nr:YqzE family protein [Sediminibacillus massiliensis]
MSGNDYVKFMTQEIVRYMDTPQEERLKQKADKKGNSNEISGHWFGLLPFAFRLLIKKSSRP